MVPPFDTQFPPVLLTKMLLVTVAEPRIAPPPRPPALLPEKEQLVTVAVPLLLMAPPPLKARLPALLPETVLLVTLSVPKLAMAPPPKADPLAMVRFWTVNVTPEITENTPTCPPPLMVITLPPSMVVLALMVFVLVTVIVAAPPQAKVTVPSKLPPPGRQAYNAISLQLIIVPVPTKHANPIEVAPNIA